MAFLTLTATTPGPCACCGVGAAVLYCRLRGGTATLIGCPEFGPPSSPPKSYRTLTLSGAADGKQWTNDSCSGDSVTSDHCDYSNYKHWDADGTYSFGGCTDCGGGCVPVDFSCPDSFSNSCLVTYNVTSMVVTRNTTGACCPASTQWRKDISDTLTYTLSDEDLESDAIARLLAGAGGIWSDYAQVGNGLGGTCDPTSCCKAEYGQRTTGFSFGYAEAQFKLVMSGLDPLTGYVVTVQVYRRLLGSSGSWALLLDSPFGFTSDGSGNYTITDQDVPNLEGYETYVCCPFVYKP